MKRYYLYKHIRLDTKDVFYIGIGVAYNKRTIIGMYPRAYSKNNRSAYWKNIVNKTQHFVEIAYECFDSEEIKQKEIEFIEFYGRKDLGLGTLVNMTNGGDGLLNPSTDVRNRLSETSKGRNGKRCGMSESARTNISNGHKGLKHSEETKRKIGTNWIGRKHSEESKLKMSQARLTKFIKNQNNE